MKKDFTNYLVKNLVTGDEYLCDNYIDISLLIDCHPSTVSVYVRNNRIYKKTWKITKNGDPPLKNWCK